MANNWKYWDANGAEQTWAVGAALPAGADMFKVEFLNQFVDAINERHDLAVVVFGYSPITAAGAVPTTHIMGSISPGAYITSAADPTTPPYSTLRGMQRAIKEVLEMGHTWKRWMYNDGDEPTFTTGYDQFDLEASRVNILCGFDDIAPDIGFRRSADGASFSAGEIQVGDIIGGWIFEDMRKVLGLMHWFGNAAVASLSYVFQGGAVNTQACSASKLSGEDPIPWSCAYNTGLSGYILYAVSSGDGDSYSKLAGRAKCFTGYPFAGDYIFRAWGLLGISGGGTYYDFWSLGSEGAWVKLLSLSHSASASENKEDWFITAPSEPPLLGYVASQAVGNGFANGYCVGCVSKESFDYE